MKNINKIEAKEALIVAMKKSLREQESFSYYSKNILKSMAAMEDLLGKMFQDIDAGFESKFWAAHDHKDMKALKQLNALINLTIDSIRSNRN